jgi:hypothetical protein
MCSGEIHNHDSRAQEQTKTQTTEQPVFVVEVEETVPECKEEMVNS